MQDHDLRQLLTANDANKCQTSLDKLARHSNEPLPITGGLAVACHRLTSGLSQDVTPLNDLDIVITEHKLAATLSHDFFIAHYHPDQKQGRMLLQLVEKTQALRIDIFTSFSPTLARRSTPVTISGIRCSLVSAQDLAARLVSVLGAVLEAETVDPKYLQRFKALEPLIDSSTINTVWQDYRKTYAPHDFHEATDLIQRTVHRYPERLKVFTYNQTIEGTCSSCKVSAKFPLLARRKVFDLLGYV